jgi:L-threonylcarbamoyladenylate synthase
VETIILRVDPDQPDPIAIRRAADLLRGGSLVAFPTETVYGLGANALSAAAVAQIYAAKGRPASDPLIVHIAAPAQLDAVAMHVPTIARELAVAFWPGPLTLVLQRGPAIPANVSAGRDTVAVRMPAHPVALALIAAAGVPVAAPSANLFTRPSPTLAAHVLEDLQGRIDLLLDGGATTIGLESTVLDLTQDTPALLRPGGVPIEALRAFMPALRFEPIYVASHATTPAQASPGTLLKHYSPRAELVLFDGPAAAVLARMDAAARVALAGGRAVGVLVPDEEVRSFAPLGLVIASLGPRDDPAAAGRRVFAGLRELDRRGVDLILAHGVERVGLGVAIWDRLIRAAEGRVVEVHADK